MDGKVFYGPGLPIVTIQEARERGLKRYFTGKPCKYGHVCEKVVVNKSCYECQKVTARKNYKKYN